MRLMGSRHYKTMVAPRPSATARNIYLTNAVIKSSSGLLNRSHRRQQQNLPTQLDSESKLRL